MTGIANMNEEDKRELTNITNMSPTVTIDFRYISHQADLFNYVRQILGRYDIGLYTAAERGRWTVQAREVSINKLFDNPYAALEYALKLLAGDE